MSKIDLLIFSKDRACQCGLLLHSIDVNAENVFNTNVLWHHTPLKYDFIQGYHRLMNKYGDSPFWQQSDSFYNSVLSWIKYTKNDYIAFSTDDTVFYKKVDKIALKYALPQYSNQVFSFRLGYNTIIQNCHTGQVQPPLNSYVNHGDWLSWDIKRYHPHDNYGYPYGLDLHVFKRSLIQPIIEEIEFQSTNELESILTNSYRHKVDELRSFKRSVAVNIPINTVTGVTRAGEQHGISKEELNEAFLDGYVIDLESIEKVNVKGCHQEIQLKLCSS